MKKFLLSSITLVSLFIVGCDTNVYQPILINQDFNLTKITDLPPIGYTTQVSSVNFNTPTSKSYAFTKNIYVPFLNGNTITIYTAFNVGNRTEIYRSYSSVDNTTSTISIRIKDSTQLTPLYKLGTTTYDTKTITTESKFNITQFRKGTGDKLKVKIIYDFPNSTANVLGLNDTTFTLPY